MVTVDSTSIRMMCSVEVFLGALKSPSNDHKFSSMQHNEMDLLHLIDSSSESGEEKTDDDSSKRKVGQKEENSDFTRRNCRQRTELPDQSQDKKPQKGSITVVTASKAPPSFFKRSIPHRQGHWAGHIMIPVKSFSPSFIRSSIRKFQHRLELHGYSGIVVEQDEIHISLSKHFSLQVSNLEPFVQQLKRRLEKERPTKLFVDTSGNILVNDERTRSFWGWSVQPNTGLRRILSHIDSVLQKYNQPTYYENPFFHISLASSVEDLAHLNQSTTTADLDHIDSDSTDTSDDGDDDFYTNDNTIIVDRILCKFGNKKTFEIVL
jgi:2'-5' RNA ligase